MTAPTPRGGAIRTAAEVTHRLHVDGQAAALRELRTSAVPAEVVTIALAASLLVAYRELGLDIEQTLTAAFSASDAIAAGEPRDNQGRRQ